MWIMDLKQMQQYYGTQVTLREGCAWEGWEREGNKKFECGEW
jgi:hypothetical protein